MRKIQFGHLFPLLATICLVAISIDPIESKVSPSPSKVNTVFLTAAQIKTMDAILTYSRKKDNNVSASITSIKGIEFIGLTLPPRKGMMHPFLPISIYPDGKLRLDGKKYTFDEYLLCVKEL